MKIKSAIEYISQEKLDKINDFVENGKEAKGES